MLLFDSAIDLDKIGLFYTLSSFVLECLTGVRVIAQASLLPISGMHENL